MSAQITDQTIEDFQRDGAVVVRGLFNDAELTLIAQGIEQNMAEPGPYAAENTTGKDTGRFFDDYVNWQRIEPFERIVRESQAAQVAARLMGSTSAQFFHDHVLVKEPGTSKPTPWHQDAPYYFVDGQQLVSLWAPLEPVKEATLRLVAGSHKWDKLVWPTRWLKEDDFYDPELRETYLDVPDPDAQPDCYQVLEWQLEPGDAVFFHYRTLHGARGNSTDKRRRAFSMRWLGDDARYISRPGRTSPPFPGHGMSDGERLREDWFPVIWRDHA